MESSEPPDPGFRKMHPGHFLAEDRFDEHFIRKVIKLQEFGK